MFCCNTKYELRYFFFLFLKKGSCFLTAKKKLNLTHTLLSSDQWTSQNTQRAHRHSKHTHRHAHSHTHTPWRQLCILPTDFQRLCSHSVFVLYPLLGCSFIIHPSSEKHLKWLCFSFSLFFILNLAFMFTLHLAWRHKGESWKAFFVSDLCHFHCLSSTALCLHACRGPDM